MTVVVLQLCLSISAVIGDCYDEAPNNETYNNCKTCFQTFANALVNSGDNKYRISSVFFPIDNISPVQVKVTYISTSDATGRKIWYWLNGGFYIFQPLELFEFRSLFFSPPAWNKESVTILLPDNCFANNNVNETDNNSNNIFFQYATQRVSRPL